MKQQHKKIILILSLVMIVLLLVGFSYAFLKTSFFANKDNILKVGKLALTLDESNGNEINVTDESPMTDEEGIAQDNYFSFTLTNNGKIASSYTIYLEDQPIDSNDTRVTSSYVHYSLEKDGFNNVARKLSSDQAIGSGIISSGQTINYKLRLWFADNIAAEEENRVFRTKIKIVASQNTKTMVSSFGLSNEEKSTFTKIVFQDKISEIENTTKIYDLSVAKNNSVVGRTVANADNTNTLYIQSDGETFANSDSDSLFAYFVNVKEIENLNLLNTSQVVNMSEMFSNSKNLTELDLSNFDTSNVTTMYAMFTMWNNTDDVYSDGNLIKLDLSSFDTSKVVSMRDMFAYNVNLSSLNVSSFNTSNVTDMHHMFSNCKSLTTIDLVNFRTSKVVAMDGIFGECRSLKFINLQNFDTSNTKYMQEMFYNNTSLLSLNLSSFDTSNVLNTTNMFDNCSALKSVDLRNAVFDSITDYNMMFNKVYSDINIIAKDASAKSWLEARLNGMGTVTIAS